MAKYIFNFVVLISVLSACVGCNNYQRIIYDPGVILEGYIDKKSPDHIYDSLRVEDITSSCPLILVLRGRSYALSEMTIEKARKIGATAPNGNSMDLSVTCYDIVGKAHKIDMNFHFGAKGLSYFSAGSADHDYPSCVHLTYKGRGTVPFPATHEQLLRNFGKPSTFERVLRE